MRKLSDAGDYMYEPPTPQINGEKIIIDKKDTRGAI